MNNSIPAKKPAPLSKASAAKSAAPTTKAPAPMSKKPAPQAKAVAPTQITDLQSYTRKVNMAKYHNHRYFVLHSPVITDAEFDELYFQIEAYEKAHPEHILPDSPTQLAGSDLTDSKRCIPHRYPMLSTEKCKTVDAIKKWMTATAKKLNIPAEEFECNIEWKYDGCSCALVYQDGDLIEATTRGDTEKQLGQDVLNHIMQIPNIPHRLYTGDRNEKGEWVQTGSIVPGRVEIRGEVLMPFASLEKCNGAYADTRTAASAMLNSDEPTAYDHLLKFMPYQLIGNDSQWSAIHDDQCGQHSALEFLRNSLGFEMAVGNMATIKDIEEKVKLLTEARPHAPFPTDGIIIKVADRSRWAELGATKHHPKYVLAYKFPPQTTVTTCTRIEITVGATGKRTPMCYFEPVTMNGKTYEKASLGSEATAASMGIAPGKRIEFALSNDVIPHINCVLPDVPTPTH